MYYVTRVAQLRDNMVAKVIADRINDQIFIENKEFHRQIPSTTPEEIEEILSTNKDYFSLISGPAHVHSDRSIRTPAVYVLSREINSKMDEEFESKFLNVVRNINKRKKTRFFLVILAILTIIAPIMLQLTHRSNIASNLSWNDYLEHTQFDSSSDFDKSLYILILAPIKPEYKKC